MTQQSGGKTIDAGEGDQRERERERLGGSKQEEMRCGEQVEMLASVF